MSTLRVFDRPLARAMLAGSMHVGVVACAVRVAARESALEPAVLASMAVGALAIFADVWAQRGDDERAEASVERWLARATALGLATVTLGGPLETAIRHSTPGAWIIAFSVVVACAGIALRARAIRVLGEQFVTAARVRGDDVLIEHDVYALLRHPSESGLILFTGAMAAMTGSVLATLGAVITALVAMARARREDATLRRSFGAAHARYALRVGSLVPRAGACQRDAQWWRGNSQTM